MTTQELELEAWLHSGWMRARLENPWPQLAIAQMCEGWIWSKLNST